MARIQPLTVSLKNGETITIRNAEGGDAFGVMDTFLGVLHERRYMLMTPEEFTPTLEQEMEWINRHNEAPHDLYIIAEQDGMVLGALGFNQKQFRRHAHTGDVGLFLASEWRGQGLGKQLMQTFLDWAEADPIIEKVLLEVDSENVNALKLYQKMGFVEEGRRINGVKFEAEAVTQNSLQDRLYADDLLMARSVRMPTK